MANDPISGLNIGGAAGGGGGGASTIADGADVAQGTTTDTAKTTDSNGTAIGFLRGLVKWAYERMPASLGQKAKTASFPVVIASDQDALGVVGNVASAASDSGNPVKVGAKYNSSAPTFTNGQRGDLQIDASGNLMVTLATGIYGEDATNNLLSTVNAPLAVGTYAWSVAQSSALEASRIVKALPGTLRSVFVRLDATAPSATYYLQILNASSLPADGAVTHLIPPVKKIHITGTDDSIGIDFTQNGIFASTGMVVVLSTTEFTKTISSTYLSVTVLYK